MQKKIFFVDGLLNVSAAQIFEYILNIISEKKDYEFFFLSPEDQNARWPSKKHYPNVIKIWFNNHYVRRLYTYCKFNNPAIIHFFFEIRMFGTLKSVLKFPFLLFLLSRTKAKIVLTLYIPFIFRKQSKWSMVENIPLAIPVFVMKIFTKLFVRAIFGFSHKIVVENNSVKVGLVEYFGVNADKIEVINNAVSLDMEPVDQLKKEKFLNRFSRKKIILCFGVISPRKGQDIAIKAFNIIKKELPDHILVIAGMRVPEFKSYEAKLERIIKELNLQYRVFDIGFLSNDEINILFDIADMTIWPYRPAIAGSGAFSFALQYNKPSIVTNIETFREILVDKGALFIDPENENQLAVSIFKLGTDPELRNQLKKQMRDIANSRDCRSIAVKHLSMYQKILE